MVTSVDICHCEQLQHEVRLHIYTQSNLLNYNVRFAFVSSLLLFNCYIDFIPSNYRRVVSFCMTTHATKCKTSLIIQIKLLFCYISLGVRFYFQEYVLRHTCDAKCFSILFLYHSLSAYKCLARKHHRQLRGAAFTDLLCENVSNLDCAVLK